MSDFDRIRANARARQQRMLQASREVQDDWGKRAAETMQATAPWEDRPENERPQGLPHARELLAYVPDHPARLEDGGCGHLIQGADYGWALELANGSAYAVVQPTMATEGPQLTAELRSKVWR